MLGLEKKTELYTKSELTQYLTPYPTLYPDSFVLQMYDLCDAPSTWQATNESYIVQWLHSRLRQDVVSKRKRVVGGLYASILYI